MGKSKFIVLNKLEARDKICEVDEYLTKISQLERKLKMNIDSDVTLDEFRDFLGQNVDEWTKEERVKLDYSIDTLNKSLKELNILFDYEILIIKTTGKEEWNSAYTRKNIIILPKKKVSSYDKEKLYELLAHEFFHVYSRYNKNHRRKLYELLGFKFIDENIIPEKIKQYSLVNPDSLQRVYTKVNYKNNRVKVSPIIMMKKDNIDSSKDILNSLKIKLFILDSNDLVEAEEFSEYIEKISVNTNNIQHPEETLAENFTYIMTKNYEVFNKDFLQEVKRILEMK